MTQFLTTLKRSGRAAVIALALVGSIGAAMPAQAAGPQFSIQLGLGGGFDGGAFGLYFGDEFDACMTDRQVRRQLRDEGFSNVTVGQDLGRHRVLVTASYGSRWYKMRVNRCTGEVDRIQRLRRSSNGSFGLHLNFGN